MVTEPLGIKIAIRLVSAKGGKDCKRKKTTTNQKIKERQKNENQRAQID
jgi:hypothetical protein